MPTPNLSFKSHRRMPESSRLQKGHSTSCMRSTCIISSKNGGRRWETRGGFSNREVLLSSAFTSAQVKHRIENCAVSWDDCSKNTDCQTNAPAPSPNKKYWP